MRILLIAYVSTVGILLGSWPAFAGEEPFEDYDFYCEAQKSADTRLKVSSGVDPSGGFDTSIEATGDWLSLNDLSFMAHRKTSKSGETSIFTSASYIRPRIVIDIDWRSEISENTFKGHLKREGFNGGAPVELSCEVEIQ